MIIFLTRQCRKPAWWPGRMFLSIMNSTHSGLTSWGLEHVVIEKEFTILDVGCGGGRTIFRLSAMAGEGKVYGIDYSTTSVAASRRTNQRAIEEGRVDVRHASVSSLPFPDGTFDVVTAVETHYYWPDPVADMREILRVLKPGATLVMIAETYRGGRLGALYQLPMKLLRATYLSVDEHRELFSRAGFSGIEMFEERARGWLCAVARRTR
ncbi:MAG: class I SAM-dependent methyltransferase [Acidobacteria bacterium]|nr:class I SAM-dependent methyltransferase [Acidobacteriota bacterium]